MVYLHAIDKKPNYDIFVYICAYAHTFMSLLWKIKCERKADGIWECLAQEIDR